MKEKDFNDKSLNSIEKIVLGNTTIERCGIELNDEFIVEFNREIVFDSLLMETGKIIPLVRGIENDEKWLEIIEVVTEEHCKDVSINDQYLWDEMIKEVVETGLTAQEKRLSFPVFSRYLIAAMLLLSVISIAIIMNEKNSLPGINSIKTTQLLTDTENGLNDIRKMNDNFAEISDENRIIAIDSGTTATIDSGAQVTDIQIGNQMVSLLVVRGAVSFSVSKKRSREFVVRAGIADIIVTGTQFRVVRMEDLLSVAVNEGSVNAMYSSGSRVAKLSTGQVALIFKDMITVVTNDSIPDLPRRTLLNNILSSDVDELRKNRKWSKVAVDSLLNNWFTPGIQYSTRVALIEDFCCILESKGRYKDALDVLEKQFTYQKKSVDDLNLLKMKSELLLKTGDTVMAAYYLEQLQENCKDSTLKCSVLFKLYKINLKHQNVQYADSCFKRYVTCNPGKKGIDKTIIEHAHILRNRSMYSEAMYWYECILEEFSESIYRSDAEYWISDCIVQKRISKKNAFEDTTGPSGW